MKPLTSWTARHLRDCGRWLSGGTPSKQRAEFWGGTIPWISAKSMTSGRLGTSEDMVTELGAENGTRLVPKDTLLFLVRGMSLKTEFRMGRTVKPVTFNQDVKALVPHPDIDPAFLTYAVQAQTADVLDAVEEAGHGTGVLPTDRLQSLVIPLPSREEQQAIAAILGALDDKIDLNRQMNRTLEEMASDLFKSWFIDFDPVVAKAAGRQPFGMDAATAALFPAGFEETAEGAVPVGWRLSSIGAETRRCGGVVQTGPFGSQLHASDYVEEGVPVIMPQDIARRAVQTEKIARVREADASRLARHRVRLGDIVFSRRGDVERHALISAREVGWLCGTGCLLVRLGAKWPSPLFASMMLDHRDAKDWISTHAVGTTMPNLNTTILQDVPIVVPTDEILRAFEAASGPWQTLIENNASESATLAKLRDLLLPQLLSGEIRVKDAEKLVEAAV